MGILEQSEKLERVRELNLISEEDYLQQKELLQHPRGAGAKVVIAALVVTVCLLRIIQDIVLNLFSLQDVAPFSIVFTFIVAAMLSALIAIKMKTSMYENCGSPLTIFVVILLTGPLGLWITFQNFGKITSKRALLKFDKLLKEHNSAEGESFEPIKSFCQEFAPALKIGVSGKAVAVNRREWKIDGTTDCSQIREMGVMGGVQFEEIWKFYKVYNGLIFVSNYGYVSKIVDAPENRELFKDMMERSVGVCYKDMSSEEKTLLKNGQRNLGEILENNASGIQVCLHIVGGDDLHRVVAQLFLKQPTIGADTSYCVHHIDNNSYNNSVTNLIYLPSNVHHQYHRELHPASY